MMTNPRIKRMLPIISVVLLVTLMVGMSELLHEKEIVFPEITALAIGALLAPKIRWQTSRIRMFTLIAICSVFGLCMSAFVPIPVWSKVILGYIFCQAVYLYSGTTFAPLISAAILPILMGTESVIYPISACGFTLLIILTEKILIGCGVKEKEIYKPVAYPDTDDIKMALLRLLIVAVIAIGAIPLGVKFCLAPPILVAFTEFTRAGNKARKTPVKAVLVIAGCAAAGAIGRMIFCIDQGLPLTLAAIFATVVMIMILKKAKMYLPPAGALAILPMIIPAEALFTYPLQVLAGTTIFMVLALKLFRNE